MNAHWSISQLLFQFFRKQLQSVLLLSSQIYPKQCLGVQPSDCVSPVSKDHDAKHPRSSPPSQISTNINPSDQINDKTNFLALVCRRETEALILIHPNNNLPNLA